MTLSYYNTTYKARTYIYIYTYLFIGFVSSVGVARRPPSPIREGGEWGWGFPNNFPEMQI